MLLPVLMLMVALLLQPALVLYTRSVMWASASETSRAAAISVDGRSDPYREFCKRRLRAIPPLDIFHAGGEDSWDITIKGAGTRKASVRVEGRLRPLPLLGLVTSVFGRMEGELLVLEAEGESDMGPDWLRGGYDSWVSMWE